MWNPKDYKKVKPINYGYYIHDHKRSLAIDHFPKSKQEKLNKGRPILENGYTSHGHNSQQSILQNTGLRRKDQQQAVLEPQRRCYHKEST